MQDMHVELPVSLPGRMTSRRPTVGPGTFSGSTVESRYAPCDPATTRPVPQGTDPEVPEADGACHHCLDAGRTHRLVRPWPPNGLWPLLVSAPLVAIVRLWRDEEVRHWLHNHRRGAEGEERVGRVLSEKLDSTTYKVFHDLDMRHGNLDHLVIGPTGAFAIETKAWRGRVWLGKHGRLMVGKRDEEGTLGQATHEAMWARQLLSDAGIDVWVEAVVVLTHTSLPKGPIDRRSVRIVTLDDLVPLLHAGRHRLAAHEVVRAEDAILRAGVPVEVPSRPDKGLRLSFTSGVEPQRET